MKKTIPQKLTAIVLSALFIMLTFTSLIPCKAEESVKSLSELMQFFPDGKYWNHVAKKGHGYEAPNYVKHYSNTECGDIENTYTSTPCKYHNVTSNIAKEGDYDCNCFDGAVQCAGFARKLAHLAYNEANIKSNWKKTSDLSTVKRVIKAGDVLHYKASNTNQKDGHWVFVIGVSGSTITVGECNWLQNCLISWGRSFDLNSITSLFMLYEAPVELKGSLSNPTSTCVSVASNTYYLKNKSTNTYMSADGTKDPSNVSVKAFSGDSVQKFVLDGSDKSYTLSPSFDTSIRLNPYSDSNGANVNVHSSQYESGNDQHWCFEAVTDGYIIHNAKNPLVVLGLDGENVRLETETGADDQIWVLESATSSSSTIIQNGIHYKLESDHCIITDNDGGFAGKLVLPDAVVYNGVTYPVTEIADEALIIGCEDVEEVILPSGLQKIGDDAFGFNSIDSITIPKSVVSIGAYNFNACFNLTEITVEDGNGYYKSSDGVLFDYGMTKLLVFPANKQISAYIIPDTVVYIADPSFSFTKYLTKIVIPGSVTSISGWNSPFHNNGLTVYYVGTEQEWNEKVTLDIISSQAFDEFNLVFHTEHEYDNGSDEICNICGYTRVLNTYTFDEETGVLTIFGQGDMFDYGVYHENDNGKYAPWFGFRDKIKEIVVSEGVTSIGEDAFTNLTNLKKVSLPSTLQKIGAFAFADCISIKELSIPDSVTKVDSFAFAYCSSLKKIKLSSNITNYGAFLFYGCSDDIEILPETVTYNDTYVKWTLDLKTGLLTFTGNGYINGTYQGPYPRNYYRGAPWLAFNKWIKNVVIGEGIIGVGYMAFFMCDIESFSLPNSLEYFRSSGINKDIDFGVIPPAVLKGNFNENIKWQIDEKKNELLIYGSGEYYSVSVWEDSPWNAFDCIIKSVVVDDGITALYESGAGDTLSYSTLTLPVSVKTIGSWSFQNGDLKTVYYKGTTEQWNEIEIEAKNDLLESADIICLGDLYTVKFVDYDDTVISEKTYNYGDTVTVPDSPVRPTDGINTYTFTGWDKEIVKVSGDITYTAVYKAEAITINENTPVIVIDNASAKAGESVTVKISLKNNPGITSLKMIVNYDEALTLTGVEYGENLTGTTLEPESLSNPLVLNWFNGLSNVNGDVVYALLTFRLPENAEAGKTYDITATYNQDDLFNININNVFFAISNGSVTVNELKPGDMNGDGKANNKDVVFLFRHVSILSGSEYKSIYDFNNDGKINNKDVVALFRFVSTAV